MIIVIMISNNHNNIGDAIIYTWSLEIFLGQVYDDIP
jgi:hypothetical protein